MAEEGAVAEGKVAKQLAALCIFYWRWPPT